MSFLRTCVIVGLSATLSTMALAANTASSSNATQTPAGQEAQTIIIADNSVTTAPAATAKLDLNKATVEQLAKIKGINAKKAQAIVQYRTKNGDFKTLDDLSSVKGFKRMKPEQLKAIQDQLTVG